MNTRPHYELSLFFRLLTAFSVFVLWILIVFSDQHRIFAAGLESHGEYSVLAGYNEESNEVTGIRFIPEFSWSTALKENLFFDAELAFNIFTFTSSDGPRELSDRTDADLYRSWIRLAGPSYELRLGLQKINFGPARILRSLRWFDQVDPRDPLQLTEGVKGILGKYYFRNNSGIWIWGLIDNDEIKGSEILRSDPDRPEYGLRYQFPVAKGEIGLTWHNRKVIHSQIARSGWKNKDTEENRYAIDGTFDLGIGFWFEATFSNLDRDSLLPDWRRYITVGGDYTFDIGTGVHVTGEHFVQSSGNSFSDQDNQGRISALSVDFSPSMLDTITILCYYDWNEEDLYPNISWQRTWDNRLLNITFFNNSSEEDTAYSGTGARVILSWNY